MPEFGITILPGLKLLEMTRDLGFHNFIAKITSVIQKNDNKGHYLLKNFCCQLLCSVISEHRDYTLGKDTTCVIVLIDKMYCWTWVSNQEKGNET